MTQQEDPHRSRIQRSPRGLPRSAAPPRRAAGKDALLPATSRSTSSCWSRRPVHRAGWWWAAGIYHIGFSSQGWSTSEGPDLTQAMLRGPRARHEPDGGGGAVLGPTGSSASVSMWALRVGRARRVPPWDGVSAEDGGTGRPGRQAVHLRPLRQDSGPAAGGHARSGWSWHCVYHVAHRGCSRRWASGAEQGDAHFTRRSTRPASWPWSGCRTRQEGRRRGHRRGADPGEVARLGSHTIEFFAMGPRSASCPTARSPRRAWSVAGPLMSDEAAAAAAAPAGEHRSLERGGLPLAAQERIEELREGRSPGQRPLRLRDGGHPARRLRAGGDGDGLERVPDRGSMGVHHRLRHGGSGDAT